MIVPFPWTSYIRKLVQRIERPRSVGSFTAQEAQARAMRLAIGRDGEVEDGAALALYWLVDEEDGIIADAKFQAFGPSSLIGAAEVACETLIGKNYDQAQRIGADLLDRQVRDRSEDPAFPQDTSAFLNMVISAIQEASQQCEGIPLAESYVAPPAPTLEIEGEGYPGWEELTLKKKLAVIEQVISTDVRPYIELDGGGIEVLNLIDDRQVIIAYAGACTNCFSATGATLGYIQQVIQAKVHQDLIVVPDL